jgi:hypothetical protein
MPAAIIAIIWIIASILTIMMLIDKLNPNSCNDPPYPLILGFLLVVIGTGSWFFTALYLPWDYYPPQTCQIYEVNNTQCISFILGETDKEPTILNLNAKYGKTFKEKEINIKIPHYGYYYWLTFPRGVETIVIEPVSKAEAK